MSTPFFERLAQYFDSIAAAMKSNASGAAVFPNTTDVGQSRELIYGRFLEAHVPPSCNVIYGGFLFSLDGSESKQVDIMVTLASAPQFRSLETDRGGKSFACVDGTIAVVSAKSTLTKDTLIDSLENFASIPMQQPLEHHKPLPIINLPGYPLWPFKVIYACDGLAPATILRHLTEYYADNPQIPVSRRVDFIHVLGKYHIVRAGEKGRRAHDGTVSPPHVFLLGPVGVDSWPLASVVCSITDYAATGRFMLFNFDALADGIAKDLIRREGYRRGEEPAQPR